MQYKTHEHFIICVFSAIFSVLFSTVICGVWDFALGPSYEPRCPDVARLVVSRPLCTEHLSKSHASLQLQIVYPKL